MYADQQSMTSKNVRSRQTNKQREEASSDGNKNISQNSKLGQR